MNIYQVVLLRIINLYQRFISASIPPRCRFHPSCSQYAADAIRARGAWRGLWLAFKRLSRCHPWNSGGFDPMVK